MGKEDRKQILDKAAACVLRDRNATHGEAEDNFKTIADYWTVHLRARGLLAPGAEIAREDVAIMSAQIKIARLAQSFDHEDNWVDGSGYFACGGGCAADRRRAGQFYALPVKLPDVGFDPARPGPDRSVATLTDGNGMPAVTAPLEQTLVQLDDLGPLEWFIRGTLPFGYQVGIAPGPTGPALYLTAPTGHKLDRVDLRDFQGDTYLDVAQVVDRQIKAWVALDTERKCARPENVHTKAPNLDNGVPFREGVLSPPPPECCGGSCPACVCRGPGCSACALDRPAP